MALEKHGPVWLNDLRYDNDKGEIFGHKTAATDEAE